MDRIDSMRLFVRIVERGSFAQAARDLNVPRPTVTHAIQKLETELGVRLLERTTRNVQPTRDGAIYRERCIRLLADFDELENAFRDNEPRGPLRVDMQGTMARFFIMPALPHFVARYPQIGLNLSEGDRMVDLIREGVDCVVRAGTLPDSSLIGRRIGMFEQVTLASPSYIERYGLPVSAEHLEGHRMVGYSASATGQAYPLEFERDGLSLQVSLPNDVLVRGAEIYTAAGLAGLGLIQVPRYRVAHQLASGDFLPILADWTVPPMEASVLYTQNRQLAPRVRVFIDWLSQVFQSEATDNKS